MTTGGQWPFPQEDSRQTSVVRRRRTSEPAVHPGTTLQKTVSSLLLLGCCVENLSSLKVSVFYEDSNQSQENFELAENDGFIH